MRAATRAWPAWAARPADASCPPPQQEPYFVARQRLHQGDPAALVKLKKQTAGLSKDFQARASATRAAPLTAAPCLLTHTLAPPPQKLLNAHERQELASLSLRQRARQQQYTEQQ